MELFSLNSIKTFVVAAKYLSFKKAADQLFVTPGAVSRQIKVLEDNLGVILFERKFRQVVLTREGHIYFKKVQPALAIIDSANQQLISLSKTPVLRVETSPTFALHWLIPKLADFKQQHPDVQIEITTSSYAIEAESSFDLYIRRDPLQFSGLPHQPFMVEYCYLACSSQLLEGINSVEQLISSKPLIINKTRPKLWKQWFLEMGIDIEEKVTDIQFENTIFSIQGAVEALGVTLVPQVFLKDLLHLKSLVCPFDLQPIATGQYHVLQRKGISHPAQHLFLDWLKQQGKNQAYSPL